MVTASDFRDGFLVAFSVTYDWWSSAHFAVLTVGRHDASDVTFRIDGLTSWSVFEDFDAQYIEQCTLLQDASGVYLALDPYIEGQRSDRDNFWFAGSAVAHCAN